MLKARLSKQPSSSQYQHEWQLFSIIDRSCLLSVTEIAECAAVLEVQHSYIIYVHCKCMYVCVFVCCAYAFHCVFTSWETNLWMVFQATRQKKFKHIHQHSTIRWYSSCYIETPPHAPTYVNLRLPSFNHHHLIATTTASTFTNIQLSPLHSVSCSSASREMVPVVGRNTTSASCSQWQPPWMCKVQGSRPQ